MSGLKEATHAEAFAALAKAVDACFGEIHSTQDFFKEADPAELAEAKATIARLQDESRKFIQRGIEDGYIDAEKLEAIKLEVKVTI